MSVLGTAALARDVGTCRRVLKALSDKELAVALEETDAKGNTPLHSAADGGHALVLWHLVLEAIAQGLTVDKTNHVLATPLHLAVRAGSAVCVETLILARADLSRQTRKGKVALDIARENNHADIVRLLQASGTRPPPTRGPQTGRTCALTMEPLSPASDVSLGVGPPLSAGAHRLFRQALRAEVQSHRPCNDGRPRVFLDVAVEGRPAGRIVIELDYEAVPKTAENFRALCTGEKGLGRNLARRPLHYKGCAFHRIIPGFMIQSGDFTSGDGRGGESIYGGKFADESFERRHSGFGCVSMANSGPNANGSQFFICLGRLPSLDGKHVVFGHVVAGVDTVISVAECGSPSGKPTKVVTVADCGVCGPDT